MINCPQKEKYVPVLTTPNPVTQTADVAVNKETSKSPPYPLALEKGIISNSVPMLITAKKPRQMVREIVINC